MLEYCISYNSSSVVPDFHSMACYGVLYSDAVDQRHFVSLLGVISDFSMLYV